MKNGKEPKFEIIRDKIFWLDDDLSLAQFLRKVWPEVMELMEPYFARVRAGERIPILEGAGALQTWREVIAFVWAAHSPHQQPQFEEKIKDIWNTMRGMQKQIYEKVEREYERRKALS
jgi:hypothetical protein